LTAKIARKKAEQLKSEIQLGKDLYAENQLYKVTPTLQEFYDEHYLPHIKQKNRSWRTTESIFRTHILPRWAEFSMCNVTRLMVTKAHNECLGKGLKPATANKMATFLRSFYNLAKKWEISGVIVNPAERFDFAEENNKVERYITQEESARLIEQVKLSKNKQLQYIIPFLLLTGARRSEALHCQWEHFNFEKLMWTIPTSLSKSKKPHHIPITPTLLELLQSIPRQDDNPYVFPSPKTGKPYTNTYQAWNTARTKAGLKDVRMHDLRHSFASALVNSGVSLYAVQNLLGHHNISVTQRYAHLQQDTLMNAANCATFLVAKNKD